MVNAIAYLIILMSTIQTFDAIIVGGGPAGSTCAAFLVKSGVHTMVLDRAEFPRVKLCAGWISPPTWEILELSPQEYTQGLWQWNRVHIHFRGRSYTVAKKGYFIRRFEFDHFLLQHTGATIVEGHNVRNIRRDHEGYWVIDDTFRAPFLIGAGGSHCPVARALFPKPEKALCGTQEREFEGDAGEIAACRAGEDGEPEVLLHANMKGYSWNVPKSQWLNVGSGTTVAREVTSAWSEARAFFEGHGGNGTIPVSSRPMLDKMKGHGYRSFETPHLGNCQAEGAFLVGDALGLAHPMTGEGIMPAILSGKLCAAAIAEGAPQNYSYRMQTHPIMSDYQLLHSIKSGVKKISGERKEKRQRRTMLHSWLVVKIFAIMFSARLLPGSHFFSWLRRRRYKWRRG